MGYAVIIITAFLLFCIYLEIEVKPLKKKVQEVVEPWRVSQETYLLRYFGIVTGTDAFHMAKQNLDSYTDRLRWIGKNHRLVPSRYRFNAAIRANAFDHYRNCFVFCDLSENKIMDPLEQVLNKCGDHITILHCLNKHLNISGAVHLGLENLDYFSLSFFFITSYTRKLWVSSKLNHEDSALQYAIKNHIVPKGSTWEDVLAYADFFMAVLDLELPKEKSQNSFYIVEALKGKVKTDLMWKEYKESENDSSILVEWKTVPAYCGFIYDED